MNNLALTLLTRKLVASWSDLVQKKAVGVAEEYHELFVGKRPLIGKTQLYGLTNIVRNTSDFRLIAMFTAHQREKALRRAEGAGQRQAEVHRRVADFWAQMEQTLAAFSQEAQVLLAKAGASISDASGLLSVGALHCVLANEYIQHLTAQILFLATQSREKITNQRRPRPSKSRRIR